MITGMNGGTGVAVSMPDQLPGPAALREQRDDAVGGADREQVQDRGLQRDGDRAEGDEQQQQREADDDADEQRQPRARRLRLVDGLRGAPADQDVGAEAPVAQPRSMSSVAGSCGEVVGLARISAVSPAGLSTGGATDAMPGSPSSTARRARRGRRRDDTRAARSRPRRSARDEVERLARVVVSARSLPASGKPSRRPGDGRGEHEQHGTPAIAAVHGRRCTARLQRPAKPPGPRAAAAGQPQALDPRARRTRAARAAA